jgi:EmrB/QacA subfamily drug resistance transporter
VAVVEHEHEQPAEAPEPPDPNRWKALTVCLVVGFMTLLDVSIVNVALPSIKSGLGAGDNALQWIVSGYALALGLFLVPSGRLGDALGRRTLLMIGIGTFVTASAACGLAPTATFLVVARLVQGFGGGLISPQISGLIQSLFRGDERGKAFGFFGTTVGISTAIGPLLGGAIIAVAGDASGWRYVFFVNIPVGLGALVLARRYIPDVQRSGARERTSLDPLGVLLLGLAVVSLLVAFIEQRSWHSPLRVALFPLSATLLAAWVGHERRYGRTHEPVVSLELFKLRSYSLGAGVGLLYFAGFTAIFFTYTQYLQNGLQYPAWKAGLAVTPFALGSAVMASAGSRAVMRVGRKLVAAGLTMVLLGLIAAWVAVGRESGPDVAWWTAAPLLLAGLGGGLVISPNVTLTLSRVPVKRAGSAGGALQTGQRIGSAAGIALTGSVFYGTLASSRGDFAGAFRDGLLVICAFVLAALALAVTDAVTASPD